MGRSTRSKCCISFCSVACVLVLVALYLSAEVTMRFSSLEAGEKFWRENPRKSDIIVSLTTLPARLDLAIQAMKSIMMQSVAVKEIRLYLSNSSEYSPLLLRSLLPPVSIYWTFDYGPAAKFIPAVLNCAANQPIVIIDDDVLHPPDLLERLAYFAGLYPTAALGIRGWNAPQREVEPIVWGDEVSQSTPVDIITGTAGYLIRPSYFEPRNIITAYCRAPPQAFYVDDIWISGLLARGNVSRLIIPTRSRPVDMVAEKFQLSLSRGPNKSHATVDIMLGWFHGCWSHSRAKGTVKCISIEVCE